MSKHSRVPLPSVGTHVTADHKLGQVAEVKPRSRMALVVFHRGGSKWYLPGELETAKVARP